MNLSKSRGRALVLGAGISGLAAAHAFQDRGYEADVLESCPSIGGLTRTVKVGDFCFDYTGHFLHLARYESPSAIPYAGLRDDGWEKIDRKSFCYVGGRLITSPIQYHLGELPQNMLKDCIDSYNARPVITDTYDLSFRDFIVSGFGRYLADLFLIPQNEKTMATSLDRLSIKAVKRFFPPPDECRVRAGMSANASRPPEYNSNFWYPKTGAIEILVDGLAHGLTNIFTLEEVVEIDLEARKVRTRKGHTWNWDILCSSIPMRRLCALTHDNDLKHWSGELTHSSTISINLGVRGALAPELREAHWIYVPDRSIPFYRVGFFSNISPAMCPADCASVYVEVGVPSEELDDIDVAGKLQPVVLQALEGLGWLKVKSITCTVINVMRCAYVHHTPRREQLVENIKQRLARYDVFPIGRYGLWDYISMEDSIYSAILTVQAVSR
jgi:protoporphyrinogen oxidase